MATDLAITVEDKPGELAALGEAAAKAGINLDGVCCCPAAGHVVVHVLVEDAAGARGAFEAAGYGLIEAREAVVVSVDDRPGALGAVARKVADAGVNIELTYLATNTRLVLAAADVDKLRAAV